MALKFDDVTASDALVMESGLEFDRWIVGEAVDTDREFIIHLSYPKFVAKFTEADECEGQDDTVASGLSFSVGDTTFYDILFFDRPPVGTPEAMALFQVAEAALTRYMRKD
jgi:hypothetical protein